MKSPDSPDPLPAQPELAFLSGGGEMGERIRDFDWSKTSAGPPAQWPQSLKTAVRIMLTSRQPIWIGWGPQLIYLYNDPYKAIIGGRHPAALGRPTAEVWPEIWDVIGPMLQTAMSGAEGTYVEEQLLIMQRHGYREETYYTYSYTPIPDASGQAGGIICANTDDTQRVVGQRQLALLRELAALTADLRNWQEVCQQTVKAFVADNKDLPFAMLYIKDESGEAVSLACAEAISPGHDAAPLTVQLSEPSPWPFAEVLRSNAPRLVTNINELFRNLPCGPWSEPPGRAIALPFKTSGEHGRVGVFVVGLNPFRQFDEGYQSFLSLIVRHIAGAITIASAYEEEKKRAEALAELDQAKTAFFSNVSHEFRTPLTLMLGPIDDLSKDVSNPEQRDRIELLRRNSLRLLKLVNSLLEFSRIEAGRLEARYESTDLATYTRDLSSVFGSAIEKAGLTFSVDCPALPEPVFVDREMWERIVLNLISNALKFTLKGEIKVSLRRHGDHVKLAISDTGIGIPASELPKTFQRFHQVRRAAAARSHEGTGIGLALVRELAHLHGGEARVESTEGQGSTFIVTLPAGHAHLRQEWIRPHSDSAPRAISKQFVEEALRWSPETPGEIGRTDTATVPSLPSLSNPASPDCARILVVDDNADMRDYVRRLLAAKFEVETAVDGHAALERIQASPPDLVLTDVMMPRMDGFDLLRHLRADARTRTLPVIMLSARAGEESRVEGLDAGADDYLIKPFSARELFARVQSHLRLSQLRRESEQRVAEILRALPAAVYTVDAEGRITSFNPAAVEFSGRVPKPGVDRWCVCCKLYWPDGTLLPLDRSSTAIALKEKRQVPGHEAIAERPDGTRRWFQSNPTPLYDGCGNLVGVVNMLVDITPRKKFEAQIAGQNKVLRAVAMGKPLPEVLQLVTQIIEQQLPGSMGSVLVANGDGTRLITGAAPHLPAEYNAQIEHMGVCEGAGSCGTAAFRREPVIVSDISTDPLWKDFHALATAHGLRACWSYPILSADSRLRGTLAIYFHEPRQPSAEEFTLLESSARVAGIAIDRDHAEKDRAGLLAREREAREEAEILNELSGVLSTQLDLKKVVQHVTDAATKVTGAKFGAFFYNVVNDQGEALMLYTLSGAPREAFEKFGLPRATPIFGPTFHGTSILRLGDVKKDPRYGKMPPHHGMPKGHLPVTSYLAVPVVSRTGEVLGGLFFGHPDPDVFTERSERLAIAIAGQAAIAIDTARLFEKAQNEINHRKQSEEVLRESEERFRALVTTTTDAIYSMNADWTEMRQLKGKGFIPDTFHPTLDWLEKYIHADDQPQVLARIREAISTKTPFEFEHRVVRVDGTIGWTFSRAVPLFNEKGEVREWFGAASDVTERKAAEEALRQARDEALAASRAKDAFLATLSHELRTPLNPVLLIASDAATDANLPAAIRKDFETISKNVELEARLIDDLLDLSRVTRGKLTLNVQRVDAHDILKDAIANIENELEQKNIELLLEFNANPSILQGDAIRLQQIFLNILKNAAKFTPHRGRITVVTSRQVEQLTVRVTDTGIGLAAEESKRIFEPFSQGENVTHRFGGLGLGLAISRQLAELHRGKIWAESEGPGKGATFIVELPA